jgi:pimeloyl-ACP methyl ester carboxylesterase
MEDPRSSTILRLMSGDPRQRRTATLLLLAAIVAGCGPANPASPSPEPSSAPPVPSVAVASPTPETSPTPIPEPTVGPARWADCGGGFACAEVRVPRDYAAPTRGYLNISMVRAAATKPAKRIGSLFVNPGGPGASGVELVREGLDVFPKALREQFDIVGFDPRGVNSSTAIRCIDNLDGHDALDMSPDDAGELDALVAAAEEYADACASRNDDTLAYLSTDAVVRDLDLLRMAVGDEKLTFLGFSYGTHIGALYAERYPARIRALVLDGAIDLSQDLEAFRKAQAVAFEGALNRFLTDCARKSSCAFYEDGRSARAFDALMASIDRDPIPALRLRDSRLVGPGLAWSAVLAGMYSKEYWPLLATALALAKAGDGSILLALSDPFRGRKPNGAYSNMQDAYVANTCLDYPAPTDVATYTHWAEDLEAKAPHFAQMVAYNDLICAFWPVPAQGQPHVVSAPDAPPIVIVGSTGDPATPFAWSQALNSQLESSVLITRKGEGHTSYAESDCVQKAVNAYLLTLKVPKAGLTCS